jgi:hypothetical protein
MPECFLKQLGSAAIIRELRDDVCTQTYAVDFQQQRSASMEAKLTQVDSTIAEHKDTMECLKTYNMELKSVQTKMAQQMLDIREVQADLTKRMEDIAQRQHDQQICATQLVAQHTSTLERQVDKKLEELQAIAMHLDRYQLHSRVHSSAGRGVDSATDSGVAPTVEFHVQTQAHDSDLLANLSSKYEILLSRVAVLETSAPASDYTIVERKDCESTSNDAQSSWPHRMKVKACGQYSERYKNSQVSSPKLHEGAGVVQNPTTDYHALRCPGSAKHGIRQDLHDPLALLDIKEEVLPDDAAGKNFKVEQISQVLDNLTEVNPVRTSIGLLEDDDTIGALYEINPKTHHVLCLPKHSSESDAALSEFHDKIHDDSVEAFSFEAAATEADSEQIASECLTSRGRTDLLAEEHVVPRLGVLERIERLRAQASALNASS